MSCGDGKRIFEEKAQGRISTKEEAEQFGKEVALKLKPRVPFDIFQ